MIRCHFIFHGRVQGVGFRFLSRYIALDLGLTGFIRNLPDGTVEMEAQGEEEKIQMLLLRLSEENGRIRIDEIKKEKIEIQKGEKGFSIV